MLLDLLHCDPFNRVVLKHPIDKIFDICGDVIRHVILALLNLVEEHAHAVVIERQTSTHHGEEYNT
jgi:hypothetical protein